MKIYEFKSLNEQDDVFFFDKYKKNIIALSKVSNNFDEIEMDYKDALMDIKKYAKKEKRDDISNQIDKVYKRLPEAFGLANDLFALEKLLKK